MEQHEVESIVNKRRTILNRATFLEKGIKIPNPEHFMWIEETIL